MKEPKIKVLQLFEKGNESESDFIFEDGGYCYSWIYEDGHIRIMHYTDRIQETTDLKEIIDELQGSKAQETLFDGDEGDVRKEKIDNDVLHEILTWHYFSAVSIKQFDIIRIQKSENDAKFIKSFLMMYGGFKFKGTCNETIK